MSALGSETFWGRVTLVGVELAAARRPIPSQAPALRFSTLEDHDWQWSVDANKRHSEASRQPNSLFIGRHRAHFSQLVTSAAMTGARLLTALASFDALVPAYAASIHKSQGSEYPAVVIPVMTQHYAMLQRNLLYTGVTRGKRLVVLVGQKKAVAIAVRNVSGRRRWRNWRNG